MLIETLERRLAFSVASLLSSIAGTKTASQEKPDNSPSKALVSASNGIYGPLQNQSAIVKTSDSPSDTTNVASGLFSPGTEDLALTASPIVGGGIHIQWEPLNLTFEGQIIVFRKSPSDLDWTDPAIAEPSYDATSYDDLTAVSGVSYEYKVVAYRDLGAAPTEKYILAANAAAPVHTHGTILLVVDSTQLDPNRDADHTTLLPAFSHYQSDLIAEGYKIRTIIAPRIDIPRGLPADPTSQASITAYFGPWSSAVMSLKAQIRSIWQQTPDLESIFLIGHVPVPYSGIDNPDGEAHALSHGAWPADVFYGSLSTPDSAWTDTIDSELGDGVNRNLPGDGKFDQDQLRQIYADTELEGTAFSDVPVGRVDFSALDPFNGIPFSAGDVATAAETKLLARYFEKDHVWRTGQVEVQRKALFEEQFPYPEYYDTNRLTPNVGLDNIIPGLTGPIENPNVTEQPQNYDLTQKSWLWMYAGAAGYPNHATLNFSIYRQLHIDHYINGIYARPGTRAASIDEGPHKSVFNFIYGSYVGDWDQPQDLLRVSIAEPDGLGLAAMWGARPKWNQHRMALGMTLGDSLLRSIDNFGDREAYEYEPYESSTRLAIMGDPTLRQDNVIPPTNVTTAANGSGPGTTISWTASADPTVAGYYVYRASSPAGPFTQLNAAMTAGVTFTDQTAVAGSETYYMVRAAKLQDTPSGTYWNLSLGTTSAPRVTGSLFVGNSKPQSIELTFDQDVESSLASGDFVITGQRRNFQTGTNQAVTLVAGVDFHLQSYNSLTRKAVIQFDVNSELNAHGVVPSGRYTLSFGAGTVSNVFEIPVAANYAFNFGYLAGDANGDLKVDFNDLVVLAQHYGTSLPGGGLSGDFNGDGVVNFDDLVVLAQHYGTIL